MTASASTSFSVRLASYRLLLSCFRQTAGFRLDEAIRQHAVGMIATDQRWLRTHVYGACRHWHIGAHLLSQASQHPLPKLDERVRTLLQLGVFWLRFLQTMPDYAAVQQIGELSRYLRLPKHLQGYINAVLRHLPPDEGPLDAWLPPWLLCDSHSDAATLVKVLREPAPIGIRIRPSQKAAIVVQQLTDAGWQVDDTPVSYNYLVSQGIMPLTETPGFAEGYWLIQDASSASVAPLIYQYLPHSPRLIVDACAGLGMKTISLADTFPEAAIIALEPDAHRFAQLQENLARCQLVHRVQVVQSNVQQWQPPAEVDCVLVDAPCSATGTVRRHPEILIRDPVLNPAVVDQQHAILETVQQWRPKTLVYSTCSVLPAENQHQVAKLVTKGWQLQQSRCISISHHQDGFFIAILSF